MRSLGERTVCILFTLCLAIILAPFALIEYPPLLDYPNHLARLFILTHPDEPPLDAYYRIAWAPIPNLGFDAVGFALAQLMPVETAGRVFLGVALALLLSAPLAVHRALYGRLSPLPLVAGALLFNRVLQENYLGYLLGVGLAVWAYAIWLALRPASTALRLAFLQVAALVVYFTHLYAIAALGVLVVMSAAAEGWRAAPPSAGARLGGMIRAVLPEVLPFVLPLVLLVASKTGGTSDGIRYLPIAFKLYNLAAALMLELSLQGILIVLAALVPALLLGLGRSRIIHPDVTWPLVTLFVLFLLLPDMLMSSNGADWRILLPGALVLVGGAAPLPGRRGAVVAGALAICVNLAAAANAWVAWREGDGLTADARTALAALPRGAWLIPYYPEEAHLAKFLPSIYHMALYAVIDRGALVPTLFARAGHQPVAIRAGHEPAERWFHWLREPDGPPPRSEVPVYLLGIDSAPEDVDPPLPVAAEMVTQADGFTLYRVDIDTDAAGQ